KEVPATGGVCIRRLDRGDVCESQILAQVVAAVRTWVCTYGQIAEGRKVAQMPRMSGRDPATRLHAWTFLELSHDPQQFLGTAWANIRVPGGLALSKNSVGGFQTIDTALE